MESCASKMKGSLYLRGRCTVLCLWMISERLILAFGQAPKFLRKNAKMTRNTDPSSDVKAFEAIAVGFIAVDLISSLSLLLP